MDYKILSIDPYLTPFKDAINQRYDAYIAKRYELVGESSLVDFSNGYQYYGIHQREDYWVYREWAPAADAMYFTGDFANWIFMPTLWKNCKTAFSKLSFRAGMP